MEYRIEKTRTGRHNAIVSNPSFGWEAVYTFETELGAQEFLKAKKAESQEALSSVLTISEYFGKVN